MGYEIHNDYRGMGFAQEAANALTGFAFSYPEVIKVLAHTLAEENVSCNVLRKSGFSFVKQYNDPEDGEVWQWEFIRNKI
ncbi:MAG: GNAT family N-acetyltransferase [Chitinophagaceae bacterium]